MQPLNKISYLKKNSRFILILILNGISFISRDDSEDWDNKHIVAEVGIPLCEGIVAFEDGNFSTAVDLLYPIRYEIARVGGSRAQVGFPLFLA